MLEYVEKIAFTASSIVSKDVEQLRELGWSDREVLDIALVSSSYSFWCRIANSLGAELDTNRIDSELLEAMGHASPDKLIEG